MTEEDIFAIVKKNLLDVRPLLDPKEITADRSMAELGANSVDRMEVITLTLEDLGLRIPLMSFAGVRNLKGLIETLHSHLA